MPAKRYFGVVLIIVAVVAALGLDHLGRGQAPQQYTLAFERGTQLSPDAQRQLEQIAAAMAARPTWSAVVVGHTGTRGDADANQALGHDRAATVGQVLRDTGIDDDRIELFSAGGSQPLERKDGESERAYQSRLSRADVRLQP